MASRKQLEQAACFSYLYCTDLVEQTLKTNQITDSKQLTDLGKTIFGKTFLGAHARDAFPFTHMKPGDKGVINTHDTNMPGEHWVAVARGVKHTAKVYVYDSFGRRHLIKPSHIKPLPRGTRLVPVDDDKEQKDAENNCGQRCLAWLMVFDQCGEEIADLL